ncbi:MAG: hypothetical protein H6623_06140 [Bdellovibrionaceae bacterium]|nr:hypothetical protein [Pseudobdellovibrionaceae bacterium]
MKFIKIALLVATSLFFMNCSSHPEINSDESVEQKESAYEDTATEESLPYGQAISDSVFNEESSQKQEADEYEDDSYEMEDARVAEDTNENTNEDINDEQVHQSVALEHEETKLPVVKRNVASVKFKNGFYTFSNNCTMKSQPNEGSASAGNVSAGKKLWLDVHSTQWMKAYKKSGTVYIPSHCLH